MNFNLKNLIKNLIFFEAFNESIKVFRLIIISTITYHLFSWILLRIFGTSLWQNADKQIYMFNLVGPFLNGGYLEHLGNIMLFWCFFLSAYLSIRKLKKGFYIAFIYLFLFIDDSLAIHQSFPALVSSYIKILKISNDSFYFSVYFERFLEIAFWILPFTLVIMGFNNNYKSKLSNIIDIKFQITNIMFFSLFAFFGIIFDQITFFIDQNLQVSGLLLKTKGILIFSLKALEEYGEVISIFFAFIWMMNFLAYYDKKRLNI